MQILKYILVQDSDSQRFTPIPIVTPPICVTPTISDHQANDRSQIPSVGDFQSLLSPTWSPGKL